MGPQTIVQSEEIEDEMIGVEPGDEMEVDLLHHRQREFYREVVLDVIAAVGVSRDFWDESDGCQASIEKAVKILADAMWKHEYRLALSKIRGHLEKSGTTSMDCRTVDRIIEEALR